MSRFNSIVVHYSEIGTKGKNRAFFEKQLCKNLKAGLKGISKNVFRRYGRIVCDLRANAELSSAERVLGKIPGIANFSPAVKTSLEMKEIKKAAVSVLENEKFSTFKVESTRSNKKFSKNSYEINSIIGKLVADRFGKKVNVKKPGLKLFVEIGEKEAFVFCRKLRGVGGLPAGSSGKLVSLLSGGLDSPVASFMMMKRGCRIVLVHAFNDSIAEKGVLAKLDRLAKKLSEVQLNSKLYIVPFGKIQREIISNSPAKQRMIVYRRFMMRIANEIAVKEKALGVVTGDSVGQVASQTLENLGCIYNASEKPVVSPLIGMNKGEIVETAKKIGTYKHSIMPYPDCCSFMIAEHPETRGKEDYIAAIEKSIKGKERLIRDAVSRAEVKKFSFP